VSKEFWSTTRIPPICCIKLSVVQTIKSPTTHSQLTCLSLVRCELFCVYDGARTHDLLNHNQALCQLSYIHHVSRVVVSNHSKVGYEPTLIPDHTGVAESIGIEPNTRRYISLSRRTLSPSRFTFRSAHNRTRTYNLRRIRSALSPIELYERLRTRKGSNLQPLD
jgi:hypothetical protein